MLSNRRTLLYTILATIVLVVSITFGSYGCKKSPDAKPAFSKVDTNIMLSAQEQYQSLRETRSPNDARTELVNSLNKTTGVNKARLGEDGSTICIEYSDNDFAALDTIEDNALSNSPPSLQAPVAPPPGTENQSEM